MASAEPLSTTVVSPAPAAVSRRTDVKVRYQQVQHMLAVCSNRTPVQCSAVFIMQYRDERDLDAVMNLVDNELSEPYSIFTYRCSALASMQAIPMSQRARTAQQVHLLINRA